MEVTGVVTTFYELPLAVKSWALHGAFHNTHPLHLTLVHLLKGAVLVEGANEASEEEVAIDSQNGVQ